MPLRLVHVVSHPIQYFVPLYRALAQRDDIELTVLFCSTTGLTRYTDPGFGTQVAWDIPLTAGYRSHFLRRAPAIDAAQGARHIVNPDVASWIRRLRPDVLWVHGYTIPTCLIAMATAAALQISILLRDEATLLEARPASREALRRLVLGPLFRHCHCCYIGQHNRAYYRHYGVAEHRLHHVPYGVDNAFFRAQHATWLPQRQAIRAELGITDDRPILLFAGKLIPKKDPLTLVRAFAQLRTEVPAHLFFLGDGPLRHDVERLAQEIAPGAVSIAGFVNQSLIGKWYTAADILVLPSLYRETWGLVVNEAMNFALPAVTSDHVGCAPDLIIEGVTGATFTAGSTSSLHDCLRTLLQGHSLAAMGEAARRHIAHWDVSSSAASIARAAHGVRNALMSTSASRVT